jgi:hypothetical protein
MMCLSLSPSHVAVENADSARETRPIYFLADILSSDEPLMEDLRPTRCDLH